MIADKLHNAHLYYSLSTKFKKSFDFIIELNEETPNGSYQIDGDLQAIVMEYDTVAEFEFGYEAHRKYIDIQYCLRGQERIKWSPLDSRLKMHTSYDLVKDRAFYNGIGEGTFVDTGNDIFAIFFPEDAHAPQMYLDKSLFIKKVVVKVPIDSLI